MYSAHKQIKIPGILVQSLHYAVEITKFFLEINKSGLIEWVVDILLAFKVHNGYTTWLVTG